MDNIWYRNPSKSGVIGRCCGDEKDHAEPTKSNAKQNSKKSQTVIYCVQLGKKRLLVLTFHMPI